MIDAQKPDHISLNTLIGRLKEGRYVIPDFQREFEWRPWDISELLRSIFLDYYIGSLLLWKGKKENFEALSCEPIYGHKGGKSEYIVLDGQQRLTALHYAILAPQVPLQKYKTQAVYFLRVDRFMKEEYDQAFTYDWLSKRMTKIMGSNELQYAEHIFPFSVLGKGMYELPNWLQGYAKFWQTKATKAHAAGLEAERINAEQHSANAEEFGEYLKSVAEQYQISYIELDADLEVDKVCDIFTQINSRGVRLDVFDLINALLKPKGLQLKHMWREASSRLSFVETEKMSVYVLQVMSLVRQAYCSPKYLYFLLPGQEKPIREPDGTRRKEILIPSIAEFKKHWEQAVDALDAAITMLRHPQEFGVSSTRYLPYVTILPVFAALQAHVKTRPPSSQLDAQRKIRHWYWASVFLNRYSGSVESTSARDYLDMKDWIDADEFEPSLVQEFAQRYRGLDLRKEIKRGSSVYNGIFNLLVLAGARDWIKGTIPTPDDLDDHHIVPASWGNSNLKGDLIHTILNRAPLTSDTNRNVIGMKLPNEYLPELIEKNGENAVRGILESHYISPAAFNILLRTPFTPADYEEFINERQKTFQEAIENLLVKERLDLPANLRDLDQDIEAVELSIRGLLARTAPELPSHVLAKVTDRIQKALAKNAALDSEYLKTLEGKLEYCDLRELQETITNKSLWPKYQNRFANTDTLVKKFDQLAELRNGIRHSRSVTEIVRKEGEAAILWFKQVVLKSVPE